jgi:hypothetical protein
MEKEQPNSLNQDNTIIQVQQSFQQVQSQTKAMYETAQI